MYGFHRSDLCEVRKHFATDVESVYSAVSIESLYKIETFSL